MKASTTKPSFTSVVAALLVCVAACSARAAHIGVYADSAATQVCADIAQGMPTTLYVVATLDEALVRGVKGAEFRIEITKPQGWFLNYTPPEGAIYIGNPIDSDGSPCTGAGVTVAFAECRRPDVAPGKVLLGTLSVTHLGGEPTHLVVKRHISPGNHMARCPLLLECNAPRNEKHCVEPALHAACGEHSLLSTGPPGHDAVFFATALNRPLGARAFASPERHPERELIVRADMHALRVPTGGTLVPVDANSVPSRELRQIFETLKVAEIGAAFPDCGSSECESTADLQWCTTVSEVARLRFNHARTARRALPELEGAEEIEFAQPAAEFLVPLETSFRMQTTLVDGMHVETGTMFSVSISKPAQLRLELMDVTGRSIRVLQDDFVPAGEHEMEWGRTLRHEGEPSSGLFSLHIEAGGQEAIYKVVMTGK